MYFIIPWERWSHCVTERTIVDQSNVWWSDAFHTSSNLIPWLPRRPQSIKLPLIVDSWFFFPVKHMFCLSWGNRKLVCSETSSLSRDDERGKKNTFTSMLFNWKRLWNQTEKKSTHGMMNVVITVHIKQLSQLQFSDLCSALSSLQSSHSFKFSGALTCSQNLKEYYYYYYCCCWCPIESQYSLLDSVYCYITFNTPRFSWKKKILLDSSDKSKERISCWLLKYLEAEFRKTRKKTTSRHFPLRQRFKLWRFKL